MEHLWDISTELKAQIRHFPPDLKQRVWEAVDIILHDPEAGKLLSEELEGFRSYRIGKYRLIYRIEKNRLILEALGRREDIYERFILEIGRAKIRERAAQYRTKPRKAWKRSPTPKRAASPCKPAWPTSS